MERIQQIHQWPMIGVLLVGVLAVAVLVLGWGLGRIEIARFGNEFPAMVPSTASLFVLAAAAIVSHTRGDQGAVFRLFQYFSASVIALVSCANLWFALGSQSSGIDLAIWPSNPVFLEEGMSPATSIAFLLLAIGIWASNGPPANRRIAVYAASLGFALSALALLVYGFDADSLVSVGVFSTLSLPSAMCFLLLFIATLSINRETSWVRVLLGSGRGSHSARRVLPLLIGLPLLLTVAVNFGMQARLFDLNFQLSLLALGNVLVLTAVVLRDARFNNLLEIEGRATHKELEQARRQEEAQRLSREKAEAAADSRSKFLANMSHEIRTPMDGVLGFAELLARSDLDAEQRRYADLIVESGDTMLSLINDILDMSKIESDKMILAEEAMDIHHLVRSTARLMQAAALRKGITLQVDIAEDTPRGFVGDSLRIRQILTNVIGNAVKFTKRGGVLVRLAHSDEGITISVRDTGIGIAEDRQEHIFEQFAQADESTSRDFGGTGLGLAISKKLTRLMGGAISLESRLGEGTTISITLPLEPVEATFMHSVDPARSTSLLKHRDWKGYRVLIAEDNNINQILVTRMVEALGAQVVLAADGNSAVECVRRAAEVGRPFHLVLMDVQMPGMDGLEATRLIRENFDSEHSPIIALTANAFTSDIQQCLDAGMQAHLAKPLKGEDLKATFTKFLSSDQADKYAGAAPKAASG